MSLSGNGKRERKHFHLQTTCDRETGMGMGPYTGARDSHLFSRYSSERIQELSVEKRGIADRDLSPRHSREGRMHLILAMTRDSCHDNVRATIKIRRSVNRNAKALRRICRGKFKRQLQLRSQESRNTSARTHTRFGFAYSGNLRAFPRSRLS